MRIDLHTHSVASHDGGLRLKDYERALSRGVLDYIAITDHNRIDFAQKAQHTLGDSIIIGEEIMTESGEIIGLYLKEGVPSGLTLEEAVAAIKKQGGIVYLPHPFETVRKGVSEGALNGITSQVDIIEVYNGRAVFQDKSHVARRFANQHQLAMAASSDAHGNIGWGRTYTLIESSAVSKETLAANLRQGSLHQRKVGVLGLAYPKYNKLKKIVSGKSKVEYN